MKELSIEEKAKRYDEAFTKARNIVNSINVGLIGKDSFEAVFPELFESEDEKMELLEHLKSCLSTSSTTIWKKKYQRWIAWLEKQNEQKPAAWSEYDEDLLLELSQCCDLNKTQVQWLLSFKYRAQPQPQREWSEEDVLAIKRIIDTIQCAQSTRNGKPRALYTDEILDNLINWQQNLWRWLYWKENKKEPVSEDLMDAANNYCVNARKDYPRVMDETDMYICNAFKAGAKWKAEQFEKNRLKHCNSITNEQAELESNFIDQHLDKYQRMPTYLDAIEYGMNLQKEQIMAKAIDGKIYETQARSKLKAVTTGNLSRLDYKVGDKVKVIVIKED